MELVITGCCGPAGSGERPLLVIDAAYTNYKSFAERTGRATVSITRTLQDDGPSPCRAWPRSRRLIVATSPGRWWSSPTTIPTGQLYSTSSWSGLARLCVKHDIWLVSDEAYRELFYTGGPAVSVWGLERAGGAGHQRPAHQDRVRLQGVERLRPAHRRPGDRQRGVPRRAWPRTRSTSAQRTSASTSSARWRTRPHAELAAWYERQREYYRGMLVGVTGERSASCPGLVVSRPDARIYSVVDVRDVVTPGFDAQDFVILLRRSEGRWRWTAAASRCSSRPCPAFTACRSAPTIPADPDAHRLRGDPAEHGAGGAAARAAAGAVRGGALSTAASRRAPVAAARGA